MNFPPPPSLAVILPAAGSSTRFGGPQSKLFETLDGTPVLLRSLAAFAKRSDVRWIIVPTRLQSDGDIDAPAEIRNSLPRERLILCAGGNSRAQSVRNALERVPGNVDWVAIHDAARPLVSQELIDRTFAAAVEHGAAVPALAVTQTIKQATGPLPAKVQRTIPRHKLWAMQTPQIVRRSTLLDAYKHCPLPLDQITDDVQLIELSGQPVWLVAGEERNLKITTPVDLKLAELLIKN